MKTYNWDHLDNEDLNDEITLSEWGIKEVIKDSDLSSKAKDDLINQYLEKLKSLYNEKRKRANS
jgi:hypothetical protein